MKIGGETQARLNLLLLVFYFFIEEASDAPLFFSKSNFEFF